MNKALCPNCKMEIVYSQLLKHTWKKPIVCILCSSKMNFDRRAWYRIMTFPLFATLAVLFFQFVGLELFNKGLSLLFLGSSLALLVISAVIAGYKLKGINLVLVSEQKT